MEEAREEDTELCTNCHKQVSKANYALHSSHCAKNIVLCDKCSEPVPRASLEDHMSEVHCMVHCDLCGTEMEAGHMDEHVENQCLMRKLTCRYCEMEEQAGELEGHEVACGSRTEFCVKCQRYIKLSDQLEHDNTSCRYPSPLPSVAPDNDQLLGYHQEEYQSEQTEGVTVTTADDGALSDERLAWQLHQESRGMDNGQLQADEELARKLANQFSMEDTVPSENMRGSHDPVDHQQAVPVRSEVGEELLIPCEWCNKGIAIDQLEHHQLQQCSKIPNRIWETESFDQRHETDSFDQHHEAESFDQRYDIGVDHPVDKNSHYHQDDVLYDNDQYDHVDLSHQDVASGCHVVSDRQISDHDIVPSSNSQEVTRCQYCDRLFPADAYRRHLEMCDVAMATSADSVPCEYCAKLVTVRNIYDHQAICANNSMLYRPFTELAIRFPSQYRPKGKGPAKNQPTSTSDHRPPIGYGPVGVGGLMVKGVGIRATPSDNAP